MKKNLRITIMLAALGVIFFCAATSFAQNGQMTGNYRPVPVTDAQVVAAAKYAVKQIAKKESSVVKLVSVKQAESQVVAGTNYRLCLEITIRQKGKKEKVTKNIQAVVFRNLKQKFELTSWEQAVCIQLV